MLGSSIAVRELRRVGVELASADLGLVDPITLGSDIRRGKLAQTTRDDMRRFFRVSGNLRRRVMTDL